MVPTLCYSPALHVHYHVIVLQVWMVVFVAPYVAPLCLLVVCFLLYDTLPLFPCALEGTMSVVSKCSINSCLGQSSRLGREARRIFGASLLQLWRSCSYTARLAQPDRHSCSFCWAVALVESYSSRDAWPCSGFYNFIILTQKKGAPCPNLQRLSELSSSQDNILQLTLVYRPLVPGQNSDLQT
jgi:hypothetical protein